MTTAIPPLPPGHPDEFLGLAMPPVEQIRIMLMRRKSEGIIIEWGTLWGWCVARVRYAHDREERHLDKHVVAWSEPYFRAAYYDQAESPAVLHLLEVLALVSRETS